MALAGPAVWEAAGRLAVSVVVAVWSGQAAAGLVPVVLVAAAGWVLAVSTAAAME
jgi:hypothetical protein